MGKLRLSGKELGRLEVLKQVSSGRVSKRKGAELLGVSYRQMLRMVARFVNEGAEGIGHRLRKRDSNHRIGADRKRRILGLYQAKYHDFGPTLAAEWLSREDNEQVGVETLRRWLMESGCWQARRRGARHRAWRERRAHWGELVQMDGSEHDWFEGRRARASLMVMIDDATNWTHARFFESETTFAAMTVFQEYVGYYGLPRALYVDRASIYKITRDSTVDEALQGECPRTQFGRAMGELDVELVLANSPQAKGRVERRHGVLQDRLVKAMRLKGISTLEGANAYLESEFLDELNNRFHVPARGTANLHRAVPRATSLREVLCSMEERMVQNDWTVSWRNRILQLSPRHQNLGLARRTIEVRELLDGELLLSYQGRKLEWEELPERPKRTPGAKTPAKLSAERYKPPLTHPWRRRSGPG